MVGALGQGELVEIACYLLLVPENQVQLYPINIFGVSVENNLGLLL